jgi:hypothetical protein
MKRSHRLSEFVKSLGRYGRPEPDEELLTEYGKARVLRVVPYEEVVEEMRRDLVASKEIERFDARVEHFLKDKKKYFECELAYPDGEVERIDWSEYLALKNGRKR